MYKFSRETWKIRVRRRDGYDIEYRHESEIEERKKEREKKTRKTEQTRHQRNGFLVSIRRMIRFERRRLLFTATRTNPLRILIHEKTLTSLPLLSITVLLILIQPGLSERKKGERQTKSLRRGGVLQSFRQKVEKRARSSSLACI